MPTIAVLITCFNRKEKTLSCLKDIYAQEKEQNVTLDVFIIDGGSSDDTPNNIHKEYPQVNIQVVPGLYWAGGMRKAWYEAIKRKDYDYF